jgi:hypothetical protein
VNGAQHRGRDGQLAFATDRGNHNGPPSDASWMRADYPGSFGAPANDGAQTIVMH